MDPSGSSAGSGVASSIGLAMACLGIETAGSILNPSSANKNLDALILPTDFAPNPPAYAGLPVVTAPSDFYPNNTTVQKSSMGLVEIGPNIPFGLSSLIGFAYAYEQK